MDVVIRDPTTQASQRLFYVISEVQHYKAHIKNNHEIPRRISRQQENRTVTPRTHILQISRPLAGLAGIEIPLIVSIRSYTPPDDGLIPATPHLTDVLSLEEILAVTVEQIPVAHLRIKIDDDVRAVGGKLLLVAWPAGLHKTKIG